MSNQDQVEDLRVRHSNLEAAINSELVRPAPDQSELSRLKREKLKIKEAIEGIRKPQVVH